MFYEDFEQTSEEQVRDLLAFPISSRKAS